MLLTIAIFLKKNTQKSPSRHEFCLQKPVHNLLEMYTFNQRTKHDNWIGPSLAKQNLWLPKYYAIRYKWCS